MKLSRKELLVIFLIVVFVLILNSISYFIPERVIDYSQDNREFVAQLEIKFKEARLADSLEMLKYTQPEKLLSENKPGKKSDKKAEKVLERPISINQADLEELQLLPRIGPATAKRIIEYRSKQGAFRTTEDLMKVKGIGPKTFEKLAPLISL